MKNKLQLTIIITVLIVIGLGAAIYKNRVLGFSFLPDKMETVYTVETKITFNADGGPVTVSMNLPDSRESSAVLDRKSITKGYEFNMEKERAVWQKKDARGEQEIFFRTTAYKKPRKSGKINFGPINEDITLSGPVKTAAENIVAEARKQRGSYLDIAVKVMMILNTPDNVDASRVLNDDEIYGGKLNLTCIVLKQAGIKATILKGIQLSEKKKKQKLKGYIIIHDKKEWVLINPRTAEVENREEMLFWVKNNESLLEIIGGSSGRLTFSVLPGKILAQHAAVKHGKLQKSKLIDFSIYSLPVAHQNTFKLLLLIPIGALVVVLLRNLVGISTSGTFLPILIAMVFLETSFFTGITLLLIVVSVGLVLRSYLSHLNLLLVPRISAVLVFVIIIYVAISVLSIKLGIKAGLQVTFFPMVITAWTIERMSILWDEEGPKDVFIQGGGTLLSAALIYFAMKNRFVGHLTYSFPELLLVVLAVIIMIGSYSGYRLTELRRFEPLVKE